MVGLAFFFERGLDSNSVLYIYTCVCLLQEFLFSKYMSREYKSTALTLTLKEQLQGIRPSFMQSRVNTPVIRDGRLQIIISLSATCPRVNLNL